MLSHDICAWSIIVKRRDPRAVQRVCACVFYFCTPARRALAVKVAAAKRKFRALPGVRIMLYVRFYTGTGVDDRTA